MLGFFKWLLSLVWGGGGTVKAIIEGLNKAHADYLNAKTETDKIIAKDRIDVLNASLADTKNARENMSNQPWWMATIACMFGLPFALHVVLIGIGTCFAAPLGWAWLDWTLHIPPFPAPYDKAEIGIIQFFYGYAAVSTSVSSIVSAVIKRK